VSFAHQTCARRISGVFSNFHARKSPDSAHAIFTENEDGTFTISIRAPLNDKRDADKLCKLFPTAGGRAAAAGINKLPAPMLDNFLAQFHNIYK